MSRTALRRASTLALLLVVGATSPRTSAAAGEWDAAKAAFKKALAAEDPTQRKVAFANLVGFDTAEAVDEIVAVLGKEQDPVVLVAGVKALGRYVTPAAMNALSAATKAARGAKRGLLLVAMRE